MCEEKKVYERDMDKIVDDTIACYPLWARSSETTRCESLHKR